jgi:hypothetical protein
MCLILMMLLLRATPNIRAPINIPMGGQSGPPIVVVEGPLGPQWTLLGGPTGPQ